MGGAIILGAVLVAYFARPPGHPAAADDERPARPVPHDRARDRRLPRRLHQDLASSAASACARSRSWRARSPSASSSPVLALNFRNDQYRTPASPFISFVRDTHINLAFAGTIGGVLLFVIWANIMIAGTSNGVNLTDGLDGLADRRLDDGLRRLRPHRHLDLRTRTARPTRASSATRSATASTSPSSPRPGWVPASGSSGGTPRRPRSSWATPAPSGSAALIAGLAICTRTELLVVVLAGLFVLESLSVMAQVASFKLTGKRMLRMAPLHHHFELVGLERDHRRDPVLDHRRALRRPRARDLLRRVGGGVVVNGDLDPLAGRGGLQRLRAAPGADPPRRRLVRAAGPRRGPRRSAGSRPPTRSPSAAAVVTVVDGKARGGVAGQRRARRHPRHPRRHRPAGRGAHGGSAGRGRRPRRHLSRGGAPDQPMLARGGRARHPGVGRGRARLADAGQERAPRRGSPSPAPTARRRPSTCSRRSCAHAGLRATSAGQRRHAHPRGGAAPASRSTSSPSSCPASSCTGSARCRRSRPPASTSRPTTSTGTARSRSTCGPRARSTSTPTSRASTTSPTR